MENEYGTYEEEYGDAGRLYAAWSAKMALRQKTGVPWIMCKEWDVPTDVVSSLSFFTTVCLYLYHHVSNPRSKILHLYTFADNVEKCSEFRSKIFTSISFIQLTYIDGGRLCH